MKKKPMAVEQEDVGMQVAESLAAMERFVVDNDDLLELESHIGRFNIFDAVGIAHVEIRHSNFLAFILDPAESHGLEAVIEQPRFCQTWNNVKLRELRHPDSSTVDSTVKFIGDIHETKSLS